MNYAIILPRRTDGLGFPIDLLQNLGHNLNCVLQVLYVLFVIVGTAKEKSALRGEDFFHTLQDYGLCGQSWIGCVITCSIPPLVCLSQLDSEM